MTTKHIALDDEWTGFQADNDDAVANAAASDLIDILNNLDVPIVVVRRDFKINCFNKAAADVLGLSPSDIGQASRDVSALAGLPRLEEQCHQVITCGLASRTDFRDGDKWFVVRISPYIQGDRKVTGALLMFTNVTAFRASIDQAVYERECTKAILNTVGDPLVVLSSDQRIQSGNRAFYAMFGVSRDETQGVSLYELANGAFELTPLRSQLEEVFSGSDAFQPVEVDQVPTGSGQRTLRLDARSLSLPGRSERRLLMTFRDITTRKQAEAARDLRSEEELRRNEAFLAEGQRLSLTGSFSWKVLTDEITWSEQLYRIYEFGIGVPVTTELIASRFHPEDISLLNEMMEKAKEAERDFEYEHRLLMPNGSVRYLHLTAHRNDHRDGGSEYIGAVQDVTERRLSEEALSKVRSELAHVARVTSLGTLTASIAHEVNQPLSGIITNASTCLRMLAADPPNLEGARETVRRTIRDGNRASEVITRLRALFGNAEALNESVDLNEAAREVIALSRSELQRKQVLLQMELADDLPPIAGDRVQLQQVILNLILNACDAMSDVDDRPRQMLVRTEVDVGKTVSLTVKDTGIGLDPASLGKLFDAFYTTKSSGMGIGLSVSKSIIDSHHGRLWATPNDGTGATFSFSVPCVSPAEEDLPENRSADPERETQIARNV